jgi:hypothetical protein
MGGRLYICIFGSFDGSKRHFKHYESFAPMLLLVATGHLTPRWWPVILLVVNWAYRGLKCVGFFCLPHADTNYSLLLVLSHHARFQSSRSFTECCISWRHSKLQLSRYIIKPQRHLIYVAWA